jgi:phenylalanine-4-hydroxylase
MATNQKSTVYTGDIIEEHIDPSQEYTAENQEIAFSEEQHAIWAELFAGIHQPYLLEHLCKEFHIGLDRLQLDPKRIPTVEHLNQRIQPNTGWHVERTVVRYTTADEWYKKFAKRTFLVTDYLRTRDQMEFTPEPDMFHDIFGHLPFLTQEFYARIEDKFAPAYMNATTEEREVIRHLAWYSTEFGLVMEDNRFKVFGAGTISGRSELTHTIMEFYRLGRDNVIDYTGDVFKQLQNHFNAHKKDVHRIIDGVVELHRQGKMSTGESGWNVIQSILDKLGIQRKGIFGGEVLLVPFEIETIALIPKTVYAFNPMFFVCESFEQMDELLDSYLKPIAMRSS